jgi:parvulin-like peptidyl-prolyl isomerase
MTHHQKRLQEQPQNKLVDRWPIETMKMARLFLPKFATALLSIVAIFAFALFSSGRASAQVVDQIIASVDGEPITMHDLREFSLANGMEVPNDRDPKAMEFKRAVLKSLITQKLMEQELKKFEGQVDDRMIDQYIDRLKEKSHATDAEFREELARHGMTYDQYRKRAKIEIEKMSMLEHQVREKVVVAPDQVAAYYKAHPKEFTVTKEHLQLAQILVAVDPKSPPAKVDAARVKAEALRKRAMAGEDFAELAKKNSDDDSKSKGGELGVFSPDDIMDQIKTAVIKLNRGQISEVVETRHGFHIIKVEDHERPGLKPLDQVKEEIRDKLSEQAMDSQFQHWLEDDLVKAHHVESYF